MPTLPKTKRAQTELTCEKVRIEYRSPDFRALYLFVGTESKTWYLKCWHKKKDYQIKIAPFDLLSYQDALATAQALYVTIVNGTYDPDKPINMPTFAQFFMESYLPKAKENKSSWKSDLSKFNTYLENELGELRIDEFSQEQIEDYLADLELKPATINKHLSLLSSVFRLAINMKLICNNPAKGIKKQIENNERVSFFTDLQSKAFDQAAAQDINEDASHLLLSLKKTGARLSELQGLIFDRIDWDQKVIRILKSKSGHARQIFLSDEVIEILRWQEQKYSGSGYVFRQKNRKSAIGHPRTTLKRILKTIGMGDSDFRTHDLRHDFCTRVLRKGKGKVTLYHVGQLAGHRSLNSTKRYAHIADDELQSLANLV
ncbi:tyrosine-type recombinase/integrase [Neptuniibacter sp. QD48_11]|uniref:tyrosine-type recombinase/integrase n=1 Tax=Neptuniibacter sp. QD48_11 TaxID=3398211 RepID=UPI0039F4BF03